MAAGTSSRFVPLSEELPKALLEVKGEILIERQIRQLNEAGITDITVVTGYKFEMFSYLKNRFGVGLVMNDDFARYNNTSSLIRVADRLQNTYICSSDNYFPNNVFLENPKHSYYSALYSKGNTTEYCLETDSRDNITGVTVGGSDCWYMIGHVFFSEVFSKKFIDILSREYHTNLSTRLGYWEDVYINNLHNLPPLKIRRYNDNDIQEFDSLDELRHFDRSYMTDTRSSIIKRIARRLECDESQLTCFRNARHNNKLCFTFHKEDDILLYDGVSDSIIHL